MDTNKIEDIVRDLEDTKQELKMELRDLMREMSEDNESPTTLRVMFSRDDAGKLLDSIRHIANCINTIKRLDNYEE